MKINMKHQLSGTRDGVDWPAPGETIDVPKAEAEQLVAQGMAVPGKPEPEKKEPPAPETTSTGPSEKAVQPGGRRRSSGK